MRHRKLTGLIVSLALTLSMSTTIFAAPAVTDAAADTSPIVILHTNDVHCGIDDSIGYAGLAAYKSEMEAQYGADRVTLVDAGDAIQGGAVGTLSDGAYVIDIMNQVGYDLAVPGNHEFDYGTGNFLDLATNRAKFPYLSCNFRELATGSTVLNSYWIEDYDGVKVAYVGISTPESLSKTTPAHFQDGNGVFLYDFFQGADGLEQTLLPRSADAHDFARGLHARTQSLVCLGKLIERPARELTDDVIQSRLETRVSLAGNAVYDFVEVIAYRNKRGDFRDGITRSFACKRGRTRNSGVYLYNRIFHGLSV